MNDFLAFVEKQIPRDKFIIFKSLFRLPHPNVSVVEKAFSKLEKVFDGRNATETYQFTDSALLGDWSEYRREVLNEPSVWRSIGWRKYQTRVNSILIVDMPKERKGSRPEPYWYWLDIDQVIDYGYNENKDEIDWIIFKQDCENKDEERIAIFDGERYRVWKGKKGTNWDAMEVEVDELHNLGYCPAKHFWSSPLNDEHPNIKKGAISTQLENLNWMLFYSISKRHLDSYASYPIIVTYIEDCDFVNEEQKIMCDGSFLRNTDTRDYIMDSSNGYYEIAKCPKCSGRKLAGAGSHVKKPLPVGGGSDLVNPVEIITIDRQALDYNVEELTRLETEFIKSVVGIGGEAQEKESVNEMQIEASFEDRTTVLHGIKTNFEIAMKWVNDTICILRYGNQFIDSSISLGTDFYVFSTAELMSQYERAKKAGQPEAFLDTLQDQIIETEHRSDPLKMEKMLLLKQLEPYRHKTIEELLVLDGKGYIDESDMIIKINFISFVDRFERENGNILEFGSLIDFNTKINNIKKQFENYAKERPKRELQAKE